MYIRHLHNSKSNFILLLFSLLIFTSNLYSQDLSQKFSAYLTEFYAVNEIPSVTAGIAVNNKILWMDSRGYSDIEHQTKSSTSTIYRIASVSKSITAVAVMQLFEKGLINLDDDALLYIPYFTHKKYKFTIRQLLSHTSGIRGYRDGEFDSKDFYPTIKDAVLKLNNDPLEYEPGTKYLYSSLAYNLLAAIIENVTKQSFVDYVTYNIFVPAGMNSTFADAQKSLIFNRARGYEKNIKREFENAALADLSIKIPGGGFISTVEDLLRFGMALMHGTLIKKGTLDKMLEPTILKNGEIKKYGLGFAIEKDEAGKTFFCHYGGGTGFVSQFLFYPNENIAAVHLINVKNGIFESPAVDLVSLYKGRTVIVKKQLSDHLMKKYLISDIDNCIKEYEKVKRNPGSYIYSADQIYSFCSDLITLNKPEDAKKFLNVFLTEYPDYTKAFVTLAEIYLKEGKVKLAEDNYNAALKIEPNNNQIKEMIKKIKS